MSLGFPFEKIWKPLLTITFVLGISTNLIGQELEQKDLAATGEHIHVVIEQEPAGEKDLDALEAEIEKALSGGPVPVDVHITEAEQPPVNFPRVSQSKLKSFFAPFRSVAGMKFLDRTLFLSRVLAIGYYGSFFGAHFLGGPLPDAGQFQTASLGMLFTGTFQYLVTPKRIMIPMPKGVLPFVYLKELSHRWPGFMDYMSTKEWNPFSRHRSPGGVVNGLAKAGLILAAFTAIMHTGMHAFGVKDGAFVSSDVLKALGMSWLASFVAEAGWFVLSSLMKQHSWQKRVAPLVESTEIAEREFQEHLVNTLGNFRFWLLSIAITGPQIYDIQFGATGDDRGKIILGLFGVAGTVALATYVTWNKLVEKMTAFRNRRKGTKRWFRRWRAPAAQAASESSPACESAFTSSHESTTDSRLPSAS